MSINDAKRAIEQNLIVEVCGLSPDSWYTIVCLSDDETIAYCKYHGMGLFRSAIALEHLHFPSKKVKEI